MLYYILCLYNASYRCRCSYHLKGSVDTHPQQKDDDYANHPEQRVARPVMRYVLGYRYDHVHQCSSRGLDADQVFDLRHDDEQRDGRREARVHGPRNEVDQEACDTFRNDIESRLGAGRIVGVYLIPPGPSVA